ncbi:MAG: hypothetical protein M3R02_19135 [Chloroflexota bacterium]|nr:hypothetical protein [Chloroflexota bacterium]
MPAADREIQVKVPERRPFTVRASYQDKLPFGWVASVYVKDEQGHESTVAEYRDYVASDPFECLGEAVRTLTQEAETGEMDRW